MIRTARLTRTAVNTRPRLHLERSISLVCPAGEVVPLKISLEQKDVRDADTHRARRTVIAPTAEILAEFCADLRDLFLFRIGATDLRSKTQGRGQYSMEPSHFAEVPKSIQEAIIKERAKN